MRAIWLSLLCLAAIRPLNAIEACTENVTVHIRVDSGHPWRPPFGLDRVGRPLTAVVEIFSEQMPVREYSLAGYLEGKEVGRYGLVLSQEKAVWTGQVTFKAYPTELAVFAKCRFQGEPEEIVRQSVQPPSFEADATAEADDSPNPVDLGTILVPADWLLISGAQKGSVEVAAIVRDRDMAGAQAATWFESAPQGKVATLIPLVRNQKAKVKFRLPAPPASAEHDVLHVTITGPSGNELWQKRIQAMIVHNMPHWPEFGATATKLRYDAPISLRDVNTG